MEKLAVFVAILTALAVLVLAIRSYYLVKRLHKLADQIGSTAEVELKQAVGAWRDAAQEVQRAAGKLDDGFGSLASTLKRIDRVTERLESGSLVQTVVAPAVLKIASWLDGVRKGMASVHGQKAEERSED